MKTLKRRRIEYKTDYKKRVKFLKSEKPRMIFRKTNKYLIAQYVVSEESQDKMKFGVTSKVLMKYGWPEEFEGSLKSISAAYLLGLVVGKKIIKEKLETPIVDLGMQRVVHGTKIFGFLKGLIDSGLEISCKEEALPEKEKIEGKELKEDFSNHFNKIKAKIEKE
jgi:large subunit ribosomal protein L18